MSPTFLVSDKGPIYPSTPPPGLLLLGPTFTGSPCRHQLWACSIHPHLWAGLFRCRPRDMSAPARTTVRYYMVHRVSSLSSVLTVLNDSA
ncbi:hypothetical protein EV363DRAFT_1167520 [Boletus edulis]|nr:hypothetical protein EV363DRAFT_1167520 [Boletus edulis]